MMSYLPSNLVPKIYVLNRSKALDIDARATKFALHISAFWSMLETGILNPNLENN